MGFRRAFDLSDFYQRFITNALYGVLIIDWITRPIHQLEHMTIRLVGVVRYGQGFHTGFAQCIHPVPQVFRIPRMHPRERHFRYGIAALEDDISVQVALII